MQPAANKSTLETGVSVQGKYGTTSFMQGRYLSLRPGVFPVFWLERRCHYGSRRLIAIIRPQVFCLPIYKGAQYWGDCCLCGGIELVASLRVTLTAGVETLRPWRRNNNKIVSLNRRRRIPGRRILAPYQAKHTSLMHVAGRSSPPGR